MRDWIKDRMPLVGQRVEALSDDGDVLEGIFRGEEWSLRMGNLGWFRTLPECVRGWRPAARFVGEVDHPTHYNQVPGIECIDVVKHFDFVLGNVIKYAWRAGNKDSTTKLEDLRKLLWYAQYAVTEEEKHENTD